eukprot:TRINITY_DN2362_c0_g2_i1.p1 TRINITY_DN2362_c0_g2~~TRINITY_DN2362_c0_g2_i1.p1  ORF type:complete len:186 (+),score=32.48 TRINITY_DN2362_c0_g2_i1:100-657(+)
MKMYIKQATGINFYCTKVCYGLKRMNERNMNDTIKYLKETLKGFTTNASPHLRSFEDFEKIVDDAKNNQDYEQRHINEQQEHIQRLKSDIKELNTKINVATATSAAGTAACAVAAFFTFGATLVAGAAVVTASAASLLAFRIQLRTKQEELSSAEEKIDKKNLEEAVKEFKAQHENFEKEKVPTA